MKITDFNNKLYLIVFIGLFITLVKAAPQTEDFSTENVEEIEQENNRDERVFLALAVEIPPTACTANDGTNTQGTCLPSSDCQNRGGAEAGTCFSGLGVCCIISKTCKTQSSMNHTYFINPDSTSTAQAACTMTLNRVSSNICQVRLDFISLTLTQPDANGLCSTDFFTVTGGTNTVPMICGDNSGLHMYIDVDPNGGVLKLSVDRSQTPTTIRTWNIMATQIPCDSRYRAPDGCLQYYTETSGTVKSFNFDDAIDPTVPFADATRQIANHNYGICVQRASGYCGIIWERDTAFSNSFTVSGSVSATSPGLIGDPASSSTGASCVGDYVVIPEGLDDVGNQNDRFCGVGFPLTVTSTATPFLLYVKHDADEAVDEGNRGFQLTYRQTTIC